jgi:hypothetical protein
MINHYFNGLDPYRCYISRFTCISYGHSRLRNFKVKTAQKHTINTTFRPSEQVDHKYDMQHQEKFLKTIINHYFNGLDPYRCYISRLICISYGHSRLRNFQVKTAQKRTINTTFRPSETSRL